ncbi:MoxR family ATPase, partial [Streptomyces rochei]|nr:MoxR family ATPase [Streptomyces rochei]
MSTQEQTSPNGWRVFHGTGRPPVVAPPLPQAPPWRRFLGAPAQPAPPDEPEAAVRRLGPGEVTPQLGPEEIDTVNAALLLRRPL